MHLKKSSKGFLVALLRALHKTAFGIIPDGLLLGRNWAGRCRGNYASGHGSFSFSFRREIRERGKIVLSGSLCNCLGLALYGGVNSFSSLSQAEIALIPGGDRNFSAGVEWAVEGKVS